MLFTNKKNLFMANSFRMTYLKSGIWSDTAMRNEKRCQGENKVNNDFSTKAAEMMLAIIKRKRHRKWNVLYDPSMGKIKWYCMLRKKNDAIKRHWSQLLKSTQSEFISRKRKSLKELIPMRVKCEFVLEVAVLFITK